MARINDLTISIDKFIGDKIFKMRIEQGWSRRDLALQIDITHQQLHKYEIGVNRISVGRLYIIAKVFEKEIGHFYDGFDFENPVIEIDHKQRICIEASRNFMKINNRQIQGGINTLIKTIVKEQKQDS